MKKTFWVIAFSLMLVIGSVSYSSAKVLDFENLYGVLPDPYDIVNWEDGSWYVYDWYQYPYTPSSGVGRTYESTYDSTPSWEFLTPVVFNGAYFSGYEDATVQMDLFRNNVLVYSTGAFSPSDIPTFFATGYSGLVDKVVINTPRPDYWVMDDLTYNATVPEPGSLLLLGIGLLGMAGVTRYKK